MTSASFVRERTTWYPVHRRNAALLGLEAEVEAELRALPASPRMDNFETYLVDRVGRTLYEIYFADFTRKFRGVDPASLSADWARTRHLGESLDSGDLEDGGGRALHRGPRGRDDLEAPPGGLDRRRTAVTYVRPARSSSARCFLGYPTSELRRASRRVTAAKAEQALTAGRCRKEEKKDENQAARRRGSGGNPRAGFPREG